MDNHNSVFDSYLARAFELAWSVKGKTIPNPAVGAVIVKDDRIVGEGATAVWGGPHAEITALKKAGTLARNGTLYVTLEPCCHYGRTPPCTDAIISAGITRTIVALRDPNPLVNGKGIRTLRSHGIDVVTGPMRAEAAILNEDYIWSITRRRAFITLKLALTLDGRIADTSGDSKWITSPRLRKIVHNLRREHAAVAVGKGTLISDNPKLDVRHGRKAKPCRIVFTSDSVLPAESFFCRNAAETRSIIVIRKRGQRYITVDADSGIEHWYTGTSDHTESMHVFTEMAFSERITSILAEGGQRIASVLLDAGLVNRLYLFFGNRILGNGKPGILIKPGFQISNCISLAERKIITTGNDMYITGIPVYPER
jgi:diaminohydroxyphosphoribosylaminopyrimidine deaminase/5-amino-6-(5-phosphoribosylamino)uracil reductase